MRQIAEKCVRIDSVNEVANQRVRLESKYTYFSNRQVTNHGVKSLDNVSNMFIHRM